MYLLASLMYDIFHFWQAGMQDLDGRRGRRGWILLKLFASLFPPGTQPDGSRLLGEQCFASARAACADVEVKSHDI